MEDQEAVAAADATAPPKPVEEQTGKQTDEGGIGAIGTNTFGIDGYSPAPPASMRTFDQMRTNPTIALARAVATMPIKTAEISFEAKDDAEDDAVKLVEDVIGSMWPRLLRQILLALDFGFAPFEKVWEVKEVDGKQRLVYRKVKQLKPHITEILQTEDGSFAGLKQGKVTIAPQYCFLFSNDVEFGDLRGRSRHLAALKPWWMWEQLCGKEGQYATKIAAILPQVEYPEGKSKDRNGTERDNFELAEMVINRMCQGKGVTMPNTLARYAQDMLRNGVDPSKLKAWVISFLETKGGAGAELGDRIRHKESLMLRGWLVPERSATEGQQGTKAEAETHGDLAVSVAGLLLKDIIADVNAYLVDPLLVYNFGADARGTVYITTGGISAEQAAFVRQIISTILTDPANLDLMLRVIDLDALLDQTGVPKRAEVVDVDPAVAGARERMTDDQIRQQVNEQALSIMRSINTSRKG